MDFARLHCHGSGVASDAERLGAATKLLWSQDEYELADELDVDADTIKARLAGLTAAEKTYIEDRIDAVERGIA